MDTATLRTFLAAAETGSFSGAAGRVNASASSVSERIKQLEHRLGVRLFARDKRGCRLTPAGRKFLAPATQAVRALDIGRAEVALPERFSRSLSFGGQYVLWDELLLAWLAALRTTMPHVAFRVTSGASARLNRDLAEGFLEMAVLYDPVFRREVGSQPLFQDRLILVTGGDLKDWRRDYVQIEWGGTRAVEIASRLDLSPETGIVLDLGARSAQWLTSQRMSGYMPLRAVARLIENGALRIVDEAPQFDFPAYVCWRRDLDAPTVTEVILSLERAYGEAR
jgi:LysR family transcriptional regulator, flagellar master operon regulator